jgi:hypothetical protein
MKNKGRIAFLIAAQCVLAIPLALFAHHGTAVYDTSKTTTVKGIATEWVWANPHCLLEFDVKDEQGNVVHWIAETSNPSDMTNRGWSKRSIKPGDEVSVTMYAAKNGRPLGTLRQVVVNGQPLGAISSSPASSDSTGKP